MKPFDHTGEFRDPPKNPQLSRLTVRNAGVTIFAQSCVFAIQLLGTVVLARMLAPSDFGLVTMVTTFSLLLSSFGLNGFTEGVLQTERITYSLASNLFWINTAGGLVVAVAFAAAGSGLAWFYGDPRITKVSMGFSLAIFFSIVPVLHLSLLKRAMRFAAVSLNDIVGRMVYVSTAIGCARLGLGYWSLVAGAIAQPFAVCVGAWILCSWLPCFPQKVPGTGRMLRYAGKVYGRFSLNYCTGNTDNLLVGWRFGPSALGFYKKAFDLFVLPSCQLLAPIAAVVIATLSRFNKDRDQYKKYFTKGLCIVAFIGMAVSADLTLIGPDVVRVLLGPKWGEAGRIFRYFAPGVGMMLIYQTQSWIHLSMGTAGRWLRWTMIELSVTVMLFLLSLHWGPIGVAAAWTASFWFLTIPAFCYATRSTQLSVPSMIASVWRYIAAAAMAGVACAGLVRAMPWLPLIAASGEAGAVARIVLNSATFMPLYLGAIVVLYGGTAPLRELARLVPHLLPRVEGTSRVFPQARDTVQPLAVQRVDREVPVASE